MILNSLNDLIKALGSQYDGKGVWLNIGGSPGVSCGETYLPLDSVTNLDELGVYFTNFIDEWCMDYVDDYIDGDELAEAEDGGDWDKVDEIRDEAFAECVADCGRKYITGLYNNAESIEIHFDGCYFWIGE